MNIFCIVLFNIVLTISLITPVFGHGVGYELLDGVQLGDRKIALEVLSSQYDNPENLDREIQFSLLDTETKVTVRDVTYEVTGYKGQTFLFHDTFKTPNGIFVFVLLPSETDEIIQETINESNFFESLVGLKQETIHLSSSIFNTGGLYTFDVKILTAESFDNRLEPAIEYDVGLSIPQRTSHKVYDPNFGDQMIDVITYYDEINDFRYHYTDEGTATISFSMQFDWDINNINQTSVVHEELVIPKTFGDLLVPNYDLTINGIKTQNETVTIDDFAAEYRTVHIILSQDLLKNLKNSQENTKNDDDTQKNYQKEMNFVLKTNDDANNSRDTVTRNGQFRIILDWEPKNIKSGEQLEFSFHIMDVFLKNRLVSIPYHFSIIKEDGVIIYSNTGTSTDSKEQRNKIIVDVPENSKGIAIIKFENLNNNLHAQADIPIVIDRILSISDDNDNNKQDSDYPITIPEWIKDNAKWWANDQISDSEFISSIKFMIENKIIKIPYLVSNNNDSLNLDVEKNVMIPEWIKDNAKWWANDQVDDQTFANSIQFLVENKIIVI